MLLGCVTAYTTTRVTKEGYALEPALAKKLRIPLERWGANHTSRYNWLVDSFNSGDDFFFVVGGESVCRIGFNRLVEKGF